MSAKAMLFDQDSWATVTEKGQVTIPKAIRDGLGVSYGGKIRFRMRYDGTAILDRPATAGQVVGRLKKYADAANQVNAYDEREKTADDRAEELGH